MVVGVARVFELRLAELQGKSITHPARCRGFRRAGFFRINYALRTPKGRHGTDSPAIDGGRIDTASMRTQPGQPRHLMLWLAAAQALTGRPADTTQELRPYFPQPPTTDCYAAESHARVFADGSGRVLVFVHGLRLRQGERLPEGRSRRLRLQ